MRFDLVLIQRATLAAALLGLFGACSDDPSFFFDPDAVTLPDSSDTVVPDVDDPDSETPDVADPDVVDPDVVDPDVVDPDVVDPDVVDPDVVDPDVVDPDVVDPDAGDTGGPDAGDTTDPCASGETCAAIGVSCEADELVTCVPDGDGCLRPFRTDCTSTPFGFCESLGAVAQCSVADPCEGLDLCPDATRTCDGETLVVCAPNENGCLLEERTACDGELRGFCDDSGDVMCDVAPDPCEGLELCTTAGVTCVDDVRESCTMNAFGCMVIERIDCGASDQVCEVDTCQSRCGDGVVDADEDCDDGNREGADGCSIMCEVELGWRCDDGEPTVCEETRCGDSILDPGEFCDDGGTRAGDGCGATCQIETGYTCVGEPSICTLDPFCGDGTIDAGEVCDDGDRFSNDGCSAACRVETGYSCVGAPSVCTLDPFCGDGTIDAGEVCDDGDRFSNDGCSAACRVETGYTCVGAPSVCTLDPFCGDGSIDAGEDCDDGDRFSNDGCSSSCEVESGYVCSDEPSICVITPSACGNGTLDRDEFEGCDDGNRVSGDGCSADCGLELPTSRASAVSFAFSITSASPTYLRQGSGCSAPSTTTETYPYAAIRVTNSSSVARSYSFGATYSLDGFLLTYAPDFDPSNPTASCLVGDDDFSYNDGPSTGGSYLEELSIEAGASVIVLLTTFSAAPTLPFTGQLNMYWSGCGDGAVGTGETCDDADVFGGDGCSSTCQEEAGFDCDGESPTLCTERVCGDGVVQGEDGEACDDGNNSPNDGCNNCQVEAGWLCEPFSEPSDCRFIACGDGFIDGDEECDDDNIASDDGCSSACELEDGFFCLADSEPTECRVLECGDGSIDYDAGERCDDGNGEAGDGCGETCRVETGFRCEGLPSVCVDETNACGDGVLAPGEGCDGNDYTPEDACNVDCVLSLPANGDTLTLMGSIDDDDGLYAAPAADCGAQSGDFFYDAYTLRNDTGDLLELDIVATLADDVDVSLRLFTSTLNLAAPGATCLAGDDDFGFLGTEAVLNNRIIGAGATIVVVVSGAEPLDSIGEYTLGIVAAGCGDGEINVGEECDDADGVDGDGCSSTCQIEDGFTCSGEPSLCDGDICGDGSFDAGEACDDGNFVVGDGCSPSCTIEDGFLCDSEFPTTCEPGECGDGVRSELAAEGCDDANTVANDGCSDTCELESGGACNNAEPQVCVLPVCGDGVMEAWETCDVADGILCQSCATPLDLFGASFSFSGRIDETDLVFRRPTATSGPCTSPDTREISYFDGWSYMNNTSVSETINVRAEWDDGDGYLFIFGDDFDPQSPFDSCLWGDDDDGGTSASELDYTLAPGESVVIVATTYNNDAPIGAYTITVGFP